MLAGNRESSARRGGPAVVGFLRGRLLSLLCVSSINHPQGSSSDMPRPALKPPRLLYLRSLLSPLLIGSILVFTLGSYFLLSNPAPAAQTTSKIGWQSWDTVEEARVKSPTPGGGATAGSEPGKGNGTTSASGDDAYIDGSLPLDVWDPLLPHRTGCGYWYDQMSSRCGELMSISRLVVTEISGELHGRRLGMMITHFWGDSGIAIGENPVKEIAGVVPYGPVWRWGPGRSRTKQWRM